MTMVLRDIEYFIAIAAEGNVGRAAERLGLSQPALSKSLRRLERSLQTKLVKKVPKGVELTGVGNAFLGRVSSIRLSLDDVAREVADLTPGCTGHLRIGANHFAVDHLLPGTLASLARSSRKITWNVWLAQNDFLDPALRTGTVDFIVSGLPLHPETYTAHESILDDEFVVIAARDHPLARRRAVTIPDLAGYQWALSGTGTYAPLQVERAFQDRSLPPPDVTLRTNAPSLLIHAVASSKLLGFQSRWDVRHGRTRGRVSEIRVKELTWVRRIGVRYRKDAYLPPVARRFIDTLKATAKTIAMER